MMQSDSVVRTEGAVACARPDNLCIGIISQPVRHRPCAHNKVMRVAIREAENKGT